MITEMLIAAGGIVVLAVIWLYNRLIRAKVRVKQAWAQVAVQLQRRHDLIPNLVEAVSGYAAHEREVLNAVTSARAAALQAPAAQRGGAEDQVETAVGRLLMLSEQYPRLQADANFQALAHQLRETESRLALARDFASSRVAIYRKLTTTFPGNLVAGAFRFPRQQMFALDDPRAAAAPEVNLDR